MTIQNNLEEVRNNIEEVLKKEGRDLNSLILLAVTKNYDVEKIREAIRLGVTDIGENRVQELVAKKEELGNITNYHMIGSLQTNKVKYIIDFIHLIHSLDRLSLLKELEKRAKNNGKIIHCLIQLNISKEKTKEGLYVEELENFVQEVEACKYVKIKGLMTMAPHYENIEDTRPVFRKAKAIFDDLKMRELKNFDMEYLSMGMSHDYKIAIEEGSNMVRIGTSIFGERDYSK